MTSSRIAFRFIGMALLVLLAGIGLGIVGGMQYLLPGFLKESLAFTQSRPLHVTLVVTWIFTAAAGGMYYYLPGLFNVPLYSLRLARMHFALFLFTGSAILLSYMLGYFGGREYLEFPPVLGAPLLLCWILFLINFVKTSQWKVGSWPVYQWMWATGTFFFVLTLAESYLWMLPWFRDNAIRDVTVQWKALGALVGSWNMLVYGTGFYVMEKISGNRETARSRITFFFYFLGLANLLFNWGHHTYPVPAAPWIREVAYLVSMTELLILGNILFFWRRSVREAMKNRHLAAFRFLSAADAWIFLNLCLAIAISVPAINHYTHGTHITVAHAMGATIGINTMILFASLYYISGSEGKNWHPALQKRVRAGFWISNVSLLVFWVSLLGAGVVRAIERERSASFQAIQERSESWYCAFAFSGVALAAGILLVSQPILVFAWNKGFRRRVP